MTGVAISRCSACAWQGTPRRLWCPACGSDRVEEAVVSGGTVAEVTTVQHIAGGAAAPVVVAGIEADGGGTLIARLEGGEPGARVRLSDDRGAPVATPADGIAT